ncbi:hypothetical protein DPEC_G00207150, partial [Dallia pectoralis]
VEKTQTWCAAPLSSHTRPLDTHSNKRIIAVEAKFKLRMNETQKMLFFNLLFIISFFRGGVVSQSEDDFNGVTRLLESLDAAQRGDNTENTQTKHEGKFEVQTIVFPNISDLFDLEVFTTKEALVTDKVMVITETDEDLGTPSSRFNTVVLQKADVKCVSKEAVQDRDAVSLKLKAVSNCEETRSKILSVLEHLCERDCQLEVFQENYSNLILISGKYIEDDVEGMAEKFNNDNIKDKIDFEEAVPRMGKSSKVVLISVLLAGVLLAILLIAGFYLKTHRPPPKGARLAKDGFQVDEENQANTLVSVAPLQSQEPLNKPTSNGESPDSQPPPTNGHSATQSPVADTEM